MLAHALHAVAYVVHAIVYVAHTIARPLLAIVVILHVVVCSLHAIVALLRLIEYIIVDIIQIEFKIVVNHGMFRSYNKFISITLDFIKISI